MNNFVRFTILLALATACSNKSSSSQEKAAKTHVASPDFGGEFPDFDLKAIAKKFDGKTFVIDASLGREVWSFAGDKVTIDDGNAQLVGKLEIKGPCELAVRMPEHDGIEKVREMDFAWNGDALYMGSGYAGAKHGDTYVACYGVDSYVLQDGACKFGGPRGASTWAPSTCSLKGNQLVADKLTWDILGDALVDSELKGHIAELVPDLAAGKAKLASR